MSNQNDFVTENGVLKKYVGPGGDVIVPEGVTEIESSAFRYCEALTSVSLPEGLTIIGDSAFQYCSNLKSVSFPESLTCILDKAFDGCESLTDVSLPSGITHIAYRTFCDCKNLISLTLPEGVLSIEKEAFCGCAGLISVTLPKTLTSIGTDAFARCRALKSINLPGGLTDIGAGAFYECGNLTDLTFSKGALPNVGLHVFGECKNLADKNGFLVLAETLFEYFGNDCTVVVPDNVTGIGEGAFYYNKTMEFLTLPDGLKCIEKSAFEGCRNLKSVTLPDELADIGRWAFYGCEKLTVITLPVELANIGAGAFGDSSISSFSISDANVHFKTVNGLLLSKNGEELIMYPPTGDAADCRIPESVKQIASGAFYGIPADRHVILPKHLKVTKSVFEGNVCFFTVYTAAKAKFPEKPIYIGSIDDLPVKLKNAAAKGFIHAEEHGIKEIAPYRQSYLEYIRRNIKTYLKDAPENEFLLRLLIEEKLIPAKEISTLIRTADVKGNTVMKAMLLEYQQTNPDAGKTDEFRLSDDDPELKRRLKQQARQEAIKKQKGIRGLSFVATGDFNHFGWTDEYTGAKDMSDLKAFIEERGGFLRSAVSGKTDYLICNDPDSDSVKSKKAKELGIPVIDEQTFLHMANETDEG